MSAIGPMRWGSLLVLVVAYSAASRGGDSDADSTPAVTIAGAALSPGVEATTTPNARR